MKVRVITKADIGGFKEYLITSEKSGATVEKYLRDVSAFAEHAGGEPVTKEFTLAYKNKLISEGYAVRSVNSVIASLNSFFSFIGWYEFRIKSIKVQRQIFCPEEKELTKAEYIRLCRTAEKKHNDRLNLVLQTICGIARGPYGCCFNVYCQICGRLLSKDMS